MGSTPLYRPRKPERADVPRPNVPLRLTVAGGALGIESYQELALGPLSVSELAWTLPNLRFPIDLSGGVDAFRHRRGELSRLCLKAGLEQLKKYAEKRLREAVGRGRSRLALWPLEQGVGIGLCGELGALAFDLHWAPSSEEARWVVANARGVGRFRVPLAQALRAAETLFEGLAERRGRILTCSELGQRSCREIAPALGARAPDARNIKIAELDIDAEGLTLWLRQDAPLPPLARGALRALELGRLALEADDQLARGEVERARAGYLEALSRAPRHPELTELVAQLDTEHADRAEAALGMLVDCMPATSFGLTGATLLARVGDTSGARQAVQNAAGQEPYAPLAALLYQELASFVKAGPERRDALDRAVAAAPALPSVRWARFAERVAAGDDRGALADAEMLEAAAHDARERYEVLMRAAEAFVERRSMRCSGQLFERALRYVPADPAATFGLARALLGSGRSDRALTLLQRAVELADERDAPHPGALIELAKLLAERYGDHPQAIARVSRVPASSDRYLEALALEGRWRATLGDVRGASLTFARLREACELTLGKSRWPEASSWLTEAAQFENRTLGDLAAAERHLATALRLAPRSKRVRRMYREAAAALAKQHPDARSSV